MEINKSYWRYQVINQGTEDDPNFGVHEIYFNLEKNGDRMWTKNPITLGGYGDLEDLIGSLEMILKDVKKYHVLNESEI